VNDDDGMRIVRGRGQKPKVKNVPGALAEVAPGQVVFLAVRVAAHLAGPARGPYTTTLCRPFDLATGLEMYRVGDLIIRDSNTVPVYPREVADEGGS
jgi:hypothetical protein